MFLPVRNLVTNLPIQTPTNCEPCDGVSLRLNQRRVMLHPLRHRVRRCDEIVEVICVEVPHQATEDILQFLVPFAGSFVQHVYVLDCPKPLSFIIYASNASQRNSLYWVTLDFHRARWRP